MRASAAAGRAPGCGARGRRRHDRARRSDRSARRRRLRARRPGGGARPSRRARRHRRRVPEHRRHRRCASSSSGTRSSASPSSRRSRSDRSQSLHAAELTPRPSVRRVRRWRALGEEEHDGRRAARARPPLARADRGGGPDRLAARAPRSRDRRVPVEAGSTLASADRTRAYVRAADVHELVASAAVLDPLLTGVTAFEAQRPALSGRGLAEAENELRGLVDSGHRVLVAFPHRGDAERTIAIAAAGRGAAARAGRRAAGRSGGSRRRVAAAPRRRGAVGAAGGAAVGSGLPPPRGRRRGRSAPRPGLRHRRRAAAGRPRRTRRPRHRALCGLRHEDGGGRHARLRRARLPRRRSHLPAARAALEDRALHRRRCARARALEARGQGLGGASGTRAGGGARARRRAAHAVRRAPDACAAAVRGRRRLDGAARVRLPVHRDRGSGARDRGHDLRTSIPSNRWTG